MRILICSMLSLAAYAASFRGLSGVVMDQTGAAIPGATIEMSNRTTKVLSSTQADSSGRFTFETMPSGNYVVTAEKTGFESRQQVVALSDPNSRLRFVYQLGWLRRCGHVAAVWPCECSARWAADAVHAADPLLRQS
jgi:Carboxypeptidase regulatory-like domain